MNLLITGLVLTCVARYITLPPQAEGYLLRPPRTRTILTWRRGAGQTANRVQPSEPNSCAVRSCRNFIFAGGGFICAGASPLCASGSDHAARPYIGAAVEAAKARVDRMLRTHQGDTGEALAILCCI
jgi:hypothetical protein